MGPRASLRAPRLFFEALIRQAKSKPKLHLGIAARISPAAFRYRSSGYYYYLYARGERGVIALRK